MVQNRKDRLMARLAGDAKGQEHIESNEAGVMSATDDVNQGGQIDVKQEGHQENMTDGKNDIMTSRNQSDKQSSHKDRHLEIWAEELRAYLESGETTRNLQLVSTRIPEALWDIVAQVCRYQRRPIKDFVHDAVVNELRRILE